MFKLTEKTEDIGNFPDGLLLIQGSPWRSTYFRVTSVAGILSISLVAYLLLRHWEALGESSIIGLGIFVGVHLAYQWWRALLYYSKIRELCRMNSGEELGTETAQNAALRIAVGGINTVLFYSFGMALVCLVLIGGLLSRLDGIR